MIITVKYLCKYRLRFAHNYVFSGEKCFNAKTNREIKQVYNGNQCYTTSFLNSCIFLQRLSNTEIASFKSLSVMRCFPEPDTFSASLFASLVFADLILGYINLASCALLIIGFASKNSLSFIKQR